MLKVGDKAPAFAAESTKGRVDLKEHLGKQPIVLIFYPRDETPICTKQLCTVRDSKQQYAKYNAFVAGINPGSLKDHGNFAERHHYDFPLVSDPDSSINRLYRVGKLLFGFMNFQQRIVYVIGFDGTIVYARKGNRPTKEIMDALEEVHKQPLPQ